MCHAILQNVCDTKYTFLSDFTEGYAEYIEYKIQEYITGLGLV
jgi:hypothetical protein